MIELTNEQRLKVSEMVSEGMGKDEAIELVLGGFDVSHTSECESVEHEEKCEESEKKEVTKSGASTTTNNTCENAISTPRKPITRIKGIIPQLCERGHIKIGKKGKMTVSGKGNSFRPPQKLDHFVITTMNKTADDDFVIDESIMKLLGNNPTEVPVTLVYDSPDLNFPTCYAYYDSAQCQCRGDGEIAVTVDGRQIQCNPEKCKNAISKKCKPNGVLSVILTNAPGVGGVYKFRTTGWNSIRNLMSSIEFIHGLVGGRIAGLPLMLTLQPKTTVIPGTKTPTTIYMVNLEYRGTIDQLMMLARNRLVSTEKMAELEEKAVGMLAEPESVEECKDIQEEFYPENCEGV